MPVLGPHGARRLASSLGATLVLVIGTRLVAQTERVTLSGDAVAIYNIAGKLRVEGGGASDVTVEITRGGTDARQLKVESGLLRGRETLRIVYPSDRIVYPEMDRGSRTTLSVRSDGTFGNGDSGDRDDGFSRRSDRSDRSDRVEVRGSGSGLEAYADLRVIVPRGKTIALHLAVGTANIANVDGDLSLDVSSAEVTTEHTRGRLSLDTGSGSVSVSDAQGDTELDTGSGGVTVSGARGDRLRIDAGSGSVRGTDIDVRQLAGDVGSGGLRFQRVKAPHAKLSTGSGGTELELIGDVQDLSIDSGSGGVLLRLPSTVGADIEVETGSGGIDSDIPLQVTKWERRYLHGTVGDGRGRIRIESGSGRVHLSRS